MDGLGGWLALLLYRQRVQEAEARARLRWEFEADASDATKRGYLADLWGSIAVNTRTIPRDAGRLVGRNNRQERGNRAAA